MQFHADKYVKKKKEKRKRKRKKKKNFLSICVDTEIWSSFTLPGQIISTTFILTMTEIVHSQRLLNYTNPRDSNQPPSSFVTYAHRNKSEVPVIFPAKIIRYLSQYAGFSGKIYSLGLCKLITVESKKNTLEAFNEVEFS